jgi:hypothetical protein
MKPRHVIRDMIIFLTSSCYKSDNAGNSGFSPGPAKKVRAVYAPITFKLLFGNKKSLLLL